MAELVYLTMYLIPVDGQISVPDHVLQSSRWPNKCILLSLLLNQAELGNNGILSNNVRMVYS